MKGYYVTFSRDTIHGQIAYMGDMANMKYCLYRKTVESPVFKLSPGEVQSYSLNDKLFYESNMATRKNHVSPVFMKVVLTSSEVNLYELDEDEFYLKDLSGEVIGLSRNTVRRDGKEWTKQAKDAYSKGILKALVIDEIYEIEPLIERQNSINSRKALLEVLESWLLLKDIEAVVYERKMETSLSIKPELVLSGGGKLLDFSQAPYSNFAFSAKPNFGVGLYGHLFVPRLSNIILINIGTDFYSNSFYSFYSTEDSNQDYIISFKQLSTALGIRLGRIRPQALFLDLNLNYAINLNSDYTWRFEENNQGVVTTNYIAGEDPVGGSAVGYTVAVGKGLALGRLVMAISAYYTGLTHSSDIGSSISYYGLRAGFSWGGLQ